MPSSLSTKLHARPKLSVLFGLALEDLFYDKKISLCVVASVLAVVGPLLLLFGLKFGIVSQLRGELLSDPRNKEIQMTASARLDEEWFATLRKASGVGFVLPLTRSLNTQADLFVDGRRFLENVELIPTAAGDPLLGDLNVPTQDSEVVLSRSAADRLKLEVGDTLNLRVVRTLDKTLERVQMQVRVHAILPPQAISRPAVLITLPLLIAVEDYRDGVKVAMLNSVTGTEPVLRSQFARARIYADSIDSVEQVAQRLQELGIETNSRVAEIKSVQAIDRVLGFVFAVIAWAAALGCAASMIGALMANIERKRKDLALLRLFGYGRRSMLSYVIAQALCLTVIGFGLGCAMYFIGSYAFNHILAIHLARGTFVCRLEFIHFGIGLASAMAISVVVCAFGGLLATRIEPAESLRDV